MEFGLANESITYFHLLGAIITYDAIYDITWTAEGHETHKY